MTSNTEQKTECQAAVRTAPPPKQGLYDPQFEHDACGVGFVVNIKGRKSHTIVQQALQVLVNLDHRGACGCEANTGDGAGILMQMPHDFLGKPRRRSSVSNCPRPANMAWACCSCRTIPPSAKAVKAAFAKIVSDEGQTLLGWRDIPTDNASLGKTAKAAEPHMMQVFIGAQSGAQGRPGVRAQALRHPQARGAANPLRRQNSGGGKWFYVSSLSCKTVIYKGMLMPEQVAKYYPDLRDPAMAIGAGAGAFAVFHEHVSELGPRASVSLHRAQRRNQHAARQHQLDARGRRRISFRSFSATTSRKFCPSSTPTAATRRCSTTASNCSSWPGRELPHAMMMMIPEPWENHESMTPEKQRVLRISFLPDGAVGRPGVHRVHRRHPHRRVPGPQRPAPVAVLRHQGRHGHHGVGSGRAAGGAGAHFAKGPVAAGPHVSGGHRTGPHRRRRGTEEQIREGASVSAMAR